MSVSVRPAAPADFPAINALAMRSFDDFVAPDCPPWGRISFSHYASPEAIAQRFNGDSDFYVAEDDGRVVGVIEMRDGHIGMLFVDGAYQRRGIARRLLDEALAGRRDGELTVNASPYAEPAYRRLGFQPDGPWRVRHGINFLPMVRRSQAAG